MDCQHRTGRQADDLFGDGAEQQVRQPRVPVRAEHDQVDLMFFRVVDDDLDGFADMHRANNHEGSRQSRLHPDCQFQFGFVDEGRHAVVRQDPRTLGTGDWQRVGDDMQRMHFGRKLFCECAGIVLGLLLEQKLGRTRPVASGDVQAVVKALVPSSV